MKMIKMIEKSKLGSRRGRGKNEENMIAWVEKKNSIDVEDVVRDFNELADKVGFDVSRVESDGLNEVGNEVVKLFTKSFSKVPKEEACKARVWMMKASCWSDHIIDAGVRIDESNGHAG